MKTLNIKSIQKRIIQLLPKEKRGEPGTFLADSCSEVSRLVAGWILEIIPDAKIEILKGSGVFGTEQAHDILSIAEKSGITILDPTIWQFFPEKSSILVGTTTSVNEAREVLQKKYGGRWHISETFTGLTAKDIEEYTNIVTLNAETE